MQITKKCITAQLDEENMGKIYNYVMIKLYQKINFFGVLSKNVLMGWCFVGGLKSTWTFYNSDYNAAHNTNSHFHFGHCSLVGHNKQLLVTLG